MLIEVASACVDENYRFLDPFLMSEADESSRL